MDNSDQTSSQKPKGDPPIKRAGKFRRLVKGTVAAITVIAGGIIYILTSGRSGSSDKS
jgi:hypothetical protein